MKVVQVLPSPDRRETPETTSSIIITTGYSPRPPAPFSPVWSSSWCLSAGTTARPSRPDAAPGRPCTRLHVRPLLATVSSSMRSLTLTHAPYTPEAFAQRQEDPVHLFWVDGPESRPAAAAAGGQVHPGSFDAKRVASRRWPESEG